MTSIYCDSLDGECFNFGNCDNCNFFIMAKNEAIAEDKALALIERYFVQDQVSSIKISKVDTSVPEPSANCEACDNYINGVCIVDFPEKEE